MTNKADAEILADAPEGVVTAVHNTYSDEWLYSNLCNLRSLADIEALVAKDKRIAELEEEVADAEWSLTLAYRKGFSEGKSNATKRR